MDSLAGRGVLKSGRFRTILLDEERPETAVVKRFHHPGRWGAWRDPQRARREFAVLQRLASAGVRVPRPLGLRLARGASEIRMERIPGARTLEALLAERADPHGRSRLMAELGRLLAELHNAGVDHPDLHPANVLVDADGHPWLIDFHAARWRRLGPPQLRRDLLTATAYGRESVGAPHRRCFLRSWRASLAPELARHGELWGLDGLEASARLHRRSKVAEWSGRWLRTSSRCVVRGGREERCYEARWPPQRGATEALPPLELPEREARARWICSARLLEHGVPVARPLRMTVRAGLASLEFDLAAVPRACDEELQVTLGRLLGLLHDRGLEPPRLGAEHLTTGPICASLLPPPQLRDVDPLALGRERFRAVRAALPNGPSGAFLGAYLRAFRDRPHERRRIAGLLTG